MSDPVILAVDCSTRHLGWAAGRRGEAPEYGLFALPGMSNLGALYAAVYNSVSDVIRDVGADEICWAMALFAARQTAAKALMCVEGVMTLAAYDAGLRAPANVPEGIARKAVLGIGSIRTRGEGAMAKGQASAEMKRIVMAWADAQGFRPQSDDVGDALVLLHYAQRQRGPDAVFTKPKTKGRKG